MKWEYMLIVTLVIVIMFVILYLVGERCWGKTQMNHRRETAFWFYRRVNRLRFNMLKEHKNVKNIVMLHLMKVSNEITNPNLDFNRARNTFENTTVFKLIDIFDDRKGHRYFMIDIGKFGGKYGGKYVFEIMEYIRVAYNQGIKEHEIGKIPKDKEELKKELETKPMLKVIK